MEIVTIREIATMLQRIFSSWTIRKKLLLVFTCVFIPALALSLVEGMNERREVIAKAKRQIMNVSESLTAQQEEIVTATRQMLGTLALSPEVQRLDVEACNTLFSRLNQQNHQYANISLLNDFKNNQTHLGRISDADLQVTSISKLSFSFLSMGGLRMVSKILNNDPPPSPAYSVLINHNNGYAKVSDGVEPIINIILLTF